MKSLGTIIACFLLLGGMAGNFSSPVHAGGCCAAVTLPAHTGGEDVTVDLSGDEGNCCGEREDVAGKDHGENHTCDDPCSSCPVNCHCACHGHLTALQHSFLTIYCAFEAPMNYVDYRNNYHFDLHIPTFEPPRFG